MPHDLSEIEATLFPCILVCTDWPPYRFVGWPRTYSNCRRVELIHHNNALERKVSGFAARL